MIFHTRPIRPKSRKIVINKYSENIFYLLEILVEAKNENNKNQKKGHKFSKVES
jgi:hypothetical protein